MKFQNLLVLISASAFAGGMLASFALAQPALPPRLSLLLLSLVILAGPVIWYSCRASSMFRHIHRYFESEHVGDVARLPKVHTTELNDIVVNWRDQVVGQQQAAAAQADELAQMHALLDKIDVRRGRHPEGAPFTSCVRRLEDLLLQLRGELDSDIRQTTSCGREIVRATEEMVAGCETQSDAVDQTTSTIEQLSERILAVCDDAESAVNSSQQASHAAQSRLEACHELIEQLKQIQNHAAIRERKLQALGQNTKEIEAIVQTIGSLSSRTDLLALNASIESVRAGEHGRGFAVVAEEVRTLAEQAAEAVVDINRRIEMVQLETHQSISVASTEHDQLHQVVRRMTETSEALEVIARDTADSTDLVKQISKSANQQLGLARDIVNSLERSNDAGKKNRSRAEGAHWTSKTLFQVIGQMAETLIQIPSPEKSGPPMPIQLNRPSGADDEKATEVKAPDRNPFAVQA